MDWSNLIQTIVTGLADGGIYAVLALALVLIHRATGVINFAQGEMAMFSTYIAWWLISDPEGWQLSFWIGFGITLAISFVGGALIYGGIIRPLARSGQITIVIATIALLITLNGAAAWIWTAEPQYILSPFPFDPVTIGDVAIPKQTIYVFGVSLDLRRRRLPHLPLHANGPHDASRRRARRTRAGCSASASSSCSPSAGGWPPLSAPSPG